MKLCGFGGVVAANSLRITACGFFFIDRQLVFAVSESHTPKLSMNYK